MSQFKVGGKVATQATFPFRGKLRKQVADNSNTRAKLRDRTCDVINETKDKKKWIVVRDGTTTFVRIQKSFITKVADKKVRELMDEKI